MRAGTRAGTHDEGAAEILAEHGLLGHDCKVLQEVVYVSECGVEGTLWQLLVLLRTSTREECVFREDAVGQLGDRYHCEGSGLRPGEGRGDMHTAQQD